MAKTDKRIKYASDTEKPVMVSVRLPRELYDRLERYATQHRQSISELLKDGAEMRLEVEADPRSRSAGSTAGDTELQIDGANILRDMQATLARHDTQMQAIMQAIERQTIPGNNDERRETIIATPANNYYEQIDTAPGGTETIVEQREMSPDQRETIPNYDTSKYRLGKLCPHGHDYQGTEQSLRRIKQQSCWECEKEGKRERRLAKQKAATR